MTNTSSATTSPVDQPARVFEHRRVLTLSRETFFAAARLVAAAVIDRDGPPTAVIGIAHGGLPLAEVIAATLSIPLGHVEARHNATDDLYEQATGTVDHSGEPLAARLAGRALDGTVLLVDDICGTGATLDAILPDLAPHLAPGAVVRTAVLCRNAGARYQPDLWVWTVDDWVHFPWETTLPDDQATEPLTLPHEVQP
jgi:hypoxanthine phosphoribosyltransferase